MLLHRLGVGQAAALVGGVLFELNGVFAWLRNAIYNPVAFLPWLLWAVERLAQARLPGGGTWRRSASVRLRARSPWTPAFRKRSTSTAYSLRSGRPSASSPSAAGGWPSLLTWWRWGAWAVLIAAPVLLAFARFLPEAYVGGHQDDLFRNATLPRQALLLTFLP